MSVDQEMKDAQNGLDEKKERSKEELSKAELEKLALEGKSLFILLIILLEIVVALLPSVVISSRLFQWSMPD